MRRAVREVLAAYINDAGYLEGLLEADRRYGLDLEPAEGKPGQITPLHRHYAWNALVSRPAP